MLLWGSVCHHVEREASRFIPSTLGGKTLGIVGVGNIGRQVAAFGRALGMRVLAYDKYLPADEARRRGAEPVASLEALLP